MIDFEILKTFTNKSFVFLVGKLQKHKHLDNNLSKLSLINRKRKTTEPKRNGNIQTTTDYCNFTNSS